MKELIRRCIVWVITFEARLILRKYKPRIVLITGSVGKTSSKDAVYAALAKRFFVRRSEKSYNSDIGAPLTVLGVPNGWSDPVRWLRNLAEGLFLILIRAPYPAWLILEVGADRPGDISRSLSWLKPDVVVATRFPDIPVHVEFYTEPADVVREELAPVAWLGEGGALIMNADDKHASGAETRPGVARLSFGFDKSADVRASSFRISSVGRMPTGIGFEVAYGGAKVSVHIPGVIGRAHVYAALAGIAVAVKLGASLVEAAEAVTVGYTPPPGRMRLIEGKNGSALIDDSYNASPVATEEALGALASIPRKGRRIAVLADMLELGTFSASEHRRIGTIAAASCDLLVTVGVRGRGIADGARVALAGQAGMTPESIRECERNTDAAAFLASALQEGDVVLVKGSQSMRMEKATAALMENPYDAAKLLPRQDGEWLSR